MEEDIQKLRIMKRGQKIKSVKKYYFPIMSKHVLSVTISVNVIKSNAFNNKSEEKLCIFKSKHCSVSSN